MNLQVINANAICKRTSLILVRDSHRDGNDDNDVNSTVPIISWLSLISDFLKLRASLFSCKSRGRKRGDGEFKRVFRIDRLVIRVIEIYMSFSFYATNNDHLYQCTCRLLLQRRTSNQFARHTGVSINMKTAFGVLDTRLMTDAIFILF